MALGNAAAIGRSIDTYYRDVARMARMDRLNALFVKCGDLAFDIGAHVGDRTASFHRLGARVVTVEPQPRVFRALRLIHGRRPGVTLIQSAVGAADGRVEMFVNSANPTVSTASTGLMAAASTAEAWRDEVWDGRITVAMTTLDALIARHGTPAFAKIDVEGHEADVLNGLSGTLPALSFEMTTIQRDVAMTCIDRLEALGRYVFNLSLGEDHDLRLDTWQSGDAMRAIIRDLPEAANSGDVYARLA